MTVAIELRPLDLTPPPSPAAPPAGPHSPAHGLSLRGRRLHFVGIGGCGMSGLARIARTAGARCTGSDSAPGPALDALRADGFEVASRQTADTLPPDADLLVVSAAIRADHPEVIEARRRGVEVLKYAQMLGKLMIGRTAVAVAGTHGKSSTTSILGHLLIQTGLDPSVIVGATCAQIGGGWRVGAPSPPRHPGGILVAEACEFDRSFHNFHPTHAIVLNVEEDHLDVYKNLDEVVEAFAVFARQVRDDGSLLIQHEMPHRLRICAGLACPVQTIGFAPQADHRVDVHGRHVELYHHGRIVASWVNPLPGEHMAYNAAVAAVTAHRLGADWADIVPAIQSFLGLDRRMQKLGVKQLDGGEVVVVDDYGHHPTEVDTTLRALRSHYRPDRLVCVFQPHQHSRTRFLLEQFAQSFSQADLTIVPHIYFSRDSEEERRSVSATDLVDRLIQRGRDALHLYPFDAIVRHLRATSRPGDLIVTMGAGDVYQIAQAYLAR